MVMKPSKVLCCMFLFAILGLHNHFPLLTMNKPIPDKGSEIGQEIIANRKIPHLFSLSLLMQFSINNNK